MLELTSLCSVLALKLNADEKNELYNYMIDNSSDEILTNMEKLMYISNVIPKSSVIGKFSYELDGITKEVNLNKNQTFRLTLSKEKLQRIKFSNVVGDIAVSSSIMTSPAALIKDENKLVGINRSYSFNGVTKNSFKQSDTIKVTLEPIFKANTPFGYYQITDIIPAGARFTHTPSRNDYIEEAYPLGSQKVVFWINYDKNYKKQKNEISYYLQAVSEGTYTIDNAMMKHEKSDIAGFSSRETMEIK